ncbi:MaoC family dehydratase [Natronomonas salsuginis]|uniref:MaoC family dehydratase n=1 Tax=Natronomonas salsuginis TaxID=2217661 RepID=A0A4U5JEW7_9EURY|nr:MaoC family dehydratase [Natronomonas salsuginis]TKR26227.1 MaoC family dehydratase [Natronomonas salsuginis]
MTLYFEDLSIGDRYEVGEYTVAKDEIIAFAEQFDPQPFHTDEEAAKDSVFGELVASGLHTLCLSVRLFVAEFVNREDGLANMGGLGMDDLRWHAPVRPGETLRVEVEVAEKNPSESHDDRGYVEFERHVYTDDTEVMTVRSYNIVRRRSAVE